MRRSTRTARAALAAALAVVLTAGPAAAENPVLDPEDDTEMAEALAEATEVQDVCYGYLLSVEDGETGQWSGTYASSSGGAGVPATSASGCDGGVVELVASVVYTSPYSEAEDSASWQLSSSLPGLDITDVEDQGFSAEALLDDGSSATTLLNAVLSLPRLAAEQAGLPPVVLEPNASPLPEGARPDGSPGSDWLRENGALLGLSVAAVVAGLVALAASRPRGRGPARPPRFTSFGPPPAARPTDPWRSE